MMSFVSAFESEHRGKITGKNDIKHKCAVCKSVTETKEHATYFQMPLVITYLPFCEKMVKSYYYASLKLYSL